LVAWLVWSMFGGQREPPYSDAEIHTTTQRLRQQLFDGILSNRQHKLQFLLSLNKNYDGRKEVLDLWTQSQALAALWAAPEGTPQQMRDLHSVMDIVFEPCKMLQDAGECLGWPTDVTFDFPSADPTLWTIIFCAEALRRSDVLTDEERKQWMGRLATAQPASKQLRPADFDGG